MSGFDLISAVGLSGAGLDPMHPKVVSTGAALDPMHLGMWDSPLLAEALVRSRAQTDDQVDIASRLRKVARIKAQGDRIWLWEPWVRAEIARAELQSRVVVSGAGLQGQVAVTTGGAAPGTALAVSITRPADESPSYADQAQVVLDRAELREDRQPEVMCQADSLWPFWAAVTRITPVTAPRTYEIVAVALTFCSTILMSLKHYVACPRPIDVSPCVQPMVETPGHGSMPSGHASAGYFFYTLMKVLLAPAGGQADPHVLDQLQRLAWRIADNRVVAGLHFPMDTLAGYAYGTAMAEYFASVCTGEPRPFRDAVFDAGAATEPLVTPSIDSDAQSWGAAVGITAATPGTARRSDILNQMWVKAGQELDDLGLR